MDFLRGYLFFWRKTRPRGTLMYASHSCCTVSAEAPVYFRQIGLACGECVVLITGVACLSLLSPYLPTSLPRNLPLPAYNPSPTEKKDTHNIFRHKASLLIALCMFSVYIIQQIQRFIDSLFTDHVFYRFLACLPSNYARAL